MAETLLLVVRGAVALGCGAAAVLALTHWLLQRGALSPFGGWARLVRNGSAWLVRPTEARVVRAGGNPQQAPYWILGVAVVGGLVLVSFTTWVLQFVGASLASYQQGPRGVIAFAVTSVTDLLMLALLVRTIGSWFGYGAWSPWMRPFHLMTEWIVRPLRPLVPPVGMFDLTPAVAWLLILVVRVILLRIIY